MSALYRLPGQPDLTTDALDMHCGRGPTECTDCMVRGALHQALMARAQTRTADALERVVERLERLDTNVVNMLGQIDKTLDLIDDRLNELLDKGLPRS